MGFSPDADGWFNICSGVALVVVGSLVLRARPRRRVGIYLAGYLLGFGSAFFGEHFVNAFGSPLSVFWSGVAREPFYLLAAAMAARLTFEVPKRGWTRATTGAAVAGAVVAIATGISWMLFLGRANFGDFVWVRPYLRADLLVWSTAWGLLWFAIFHLTFAFDPARDPGHQKTIAGTLALWPIALASGNVMGATEGSSQLDLLGWLAWSAAWVLPILIVIAAWATLLVRYPMRVTRNGLLITAATGAAAFLIAAVVPTGSWPYGIARFVAALWLAFAIMRRQLFGLDLRVKWALKQSTVAAIFVAVFFIASEAAQQFFGEQAGNQYYGIIAAGLLVFAFAPLQRLAERVSTSALPDAKPVAELGRADKEFMYSQAVAAAWADGALSRDERAMLDRMRRSLDLSDEDAARIERSTIT